MSSAAQATPLSASWRASRSAVHREPAAPHVPWYLWTGALAVTAASIGGAWNVYCGRNPNPSALWPMDAHGAALRKAERRPGAGSTIPVGRGPGAALRTILGLWLALLPLCSSRAAYAHVGSKDVFEQISAGPYKLFVTIRPPTVVPGVAIVEVRTLGPQVSAIRVAPAPLVGEAARHSPASDELKRSPADPAFFSGSVWLMATGSWQIRFGVEGAGGRAMGSVPVPAVVLSVRRMPRSLGLILAGLGLVLALGMAGIVSAAVREAQLPPGEPEPVSHSRRGLFAGSVALVTIIMMVWFGNRWWNVEAADYRNAVFKPLTLHPLLQGGTLDLRIDPGEPDAGGRRRSNADLLLDHGKVMHLYALRWPEMDAAYHLHPSSVAPGELRSTLPDMVPGTYHLFGDIVHRNGLPETLTATLVVPPGASRATLDADDAEATPAPLSRGDLGNRYRLPDAYTMVWDRPATLTANTAELFRFTLYDRTGELATDVVPYLGMAGHAAFVRTDGSVFAHTHPDGSAAMPAMMLANAGADGPSNMAAMPMDGLGETGGFQQSAGETAKPPDSLDPLVEFPYGFPAGGRYRIFVQMKHGKTVETGVFDAEVKPAT